MPQDGILDRTSGAAQTVGERFKCSICSKSFEQRSSRDRHLRRCRQKQLTGTIPRKKSCALCTQAKTRCDLRTPACSRCKVKGLDCRYYSPPVVHGAPASPPIPTPHEENSLPTPAATDTEHIDDTNDTNFNASLGDVAIVDWGEISSSLLDWAPMFGLVGTPDHALEPETPLGTPGGYRSVIAVCPNDDNSVISREQLRAAQPSRLISVESFTHMRHRLNTEPEAGTVKYRFDKFGFMNHVVRAYPKMLVGSTLPPFIHWSSLAPGKISEALANCKGLVEMYKSMTPENKQFVMKTIAQEHERILQQYMSCNELEMLSILQAALIYGLIRHFEDDLTMDRQILMQIETIGFNVGLGGLMARGELESTRPVWEEWILAESKRRTLLTVYIFDASFHHSRGLQTLANHELGDLPLPTIKSLWECTDKAKWEWEYERYLTELKGERLPRVQDAWPPADNTTFESWYAGMDTFGVTVFALCQNCAELP